MDTRSGPDWERRRGRQSRFASLFYSAVYETQFIYQSCSYLVEMPTFERARSKTKLESGVPFYPLILFRCYGRLRRKFHLGSFRRCDLVIYRFLKTYFCYKKVL